MYQRIIYLWLTFFITVPAIAGWSVDFSRREKDLRDRNIETTPVSKSGSLDSVVPYENQNRQELAGGVKKSSSGDGFFDFVFKGNEPARDIVLLNTESGFIPSTLRVQQGVPYKIHVVNINNKEKNISFVLDAFSEHHATYYGKIKTFYIRPQKSGVYKFESPETAAQGRLVVAPGPASPHPNSDSQNLRVPASE